MTTSPDTASPVADSRPISARLRAATAVAHERAESATFVDDLMSGRLDAGQYTSLAAQLYFVYRALEQVGDDLSDDPVAAAVLDDKLRRLPRLHADLVSLGIDPAGITPLPAVARYVEAIEATRDDAARYVAHHYTRYLGDLSGGQHIYKVMQRRFGLGDDGIAFYLFAEIADPAEFKNEYRAALDGFSWSEAEADRVIDEVIAAYELNTDVFRDLSAAKAAVAV